MRVVKYLAVFCTFVVACNSKSNSSADSSANPINSSSNQSNEALANGKLNTPPTDTIFGAGEHPSLDTSEKDNAAKKPTNKIDTVRLNEVLSELTTIEAISVVNEDVQVAFSHINWAWGNHGPCTKFVLCATYVGNFEITFGSGGVGFNKVVQRLTTSAHDCIQNAKNALLGERRDGNNPDRGLAVAWVMASQIHNRPVYEWLRTHGDAVIAALGQIH